MDELPHTYAFILGSHPELSFFELQSVFELMHLEKRHLSLHNHIALAHTRKPLDHEKLMGRLGGTVKIVELVGAFTDSALGDWLFEQINTDSKFHFGFSAYAMDDSNVKKMQKTLQRLGLNMKKAMKKNGISARYVQSREIALSSVIVHKERLLKNGVDIVLLKNRDGIQFGKTLAVQPFQQFSKRDYGRPARDHRSGMLPPKVARMMVNMAQPEKNDIILDPFCGSGTVLTESLLMKYTHVIGSDVSKQAVHDTLENLAWLKLPKIEVHLADVQTLDQRLGNKSVQCIVAEGDLGTPKARNPQEERNRLRSLYVNAIESLSNVLAVGGRMVLALPAWKQKNDLLTLDLEDAIEQNGLKHFHEPLLYGRPHAHVIRHIHFLTTQKQPD